MRGLIRFWPTVVASAVGWFGSALFLTRWHGWLLELIGYCLSAAICVAFQAHWEKR